MARTKIQPIQLNKVFWEEIGRTTLTPAGDTITVSSLAARKYIRLIIDLRSTGGTITAGLRFNNDSANNYAWRASISGGAESTATSTSSILSDSGGASTSPLFCVFDIVNISTEEKLLVGMMNARASAGAATAPVRVEVAGKWANTSNAISRVDLVNLSGTGDFIAGSEVIVLGHD